MLIKLKTFQNNSNLWCHKSHIKLWQSTSLNLSLTWIQICIEAETVQHKTAGCKIQKGKALRNTINKWLEHRNTSGTLRYKLIANKLDIMVPNKQEKKVQLEKYQGLKE